MMRMLETVHTPRVGRGAESVVSDCPPMSILRGAVSSLQTFRPETEPISSCMERAKLFFTVNNVGKDKVVPVFLSVVGFQT